MSNAKESETTLRLERLIPSPPEVLFGLWTEPVQLLKWWGPDGYETSVHSSKRGPAAAGASSCAGPTAARWR